MQNPIITQRSKAAHKANLLLLTRNLRKINLGSPPLINPTFFGLMLINTSLKLHYKYISISAHGDSATPSETPGLFAILLVVQLSLSSLLIPFNPHSSNLRHSFLCFTQSQLINASHYSQTTHYSQKALISELISSHSLKTAHIVSFMPYEHTLTKSLV